MSAQRTHKSFAKMLFFIFHLISITMLSGSWAASWPGLMPDMDIDQSSFAKSKCAEYIINSNIVENDLVVVWRRRDSKVIGHPLIKRIMSVANVVIASEFETSQLWYKYSDVNASAHDAQRQMAPDDDESFPHKLNEGNVFIIETSSSACDRAIATISKSIVYNSRANFVLLVSNERNDTTTETTSTHSCENEIKWKNHSHNDEQCDAINTRSRTTFDNVTNPAGVDRKINDEKMMHGTLEHVFRLLWTRHIFNVVIMLCETIDTATTATTTADACAFYTWFPFDERSECGQRIEHFVKIDECVYDKNRNHLQFHYAEENKWYFGVSDGGDEQGQINNGNGQWTNESGPKHATHRRNHVPNENKIAVGLANVPPCTFAYAFERDENFNNNISLFDVSTSPANGGFEMKIANSSNGDANDDDVSAVDSIEPFNLCAWNAVHPFVRLFVINETQPNRERVQNQEFARNYFKYEYHEFGTIEFRKNRFFGHSSNVAGASASASASIPTNNTNMSNANATRSPSIIRRIISKRHRPHFYEKIPSDLLGCVYDTLVIVWPPFVTPAAAAFYGLEHKLLLDVARHMNYRMNETHKQFGKLLQDGRKTAYSYGILVNSSASLAFGNIYPMANMQNKFDATLGYLYDHVNWVVPLATTAPAWLNLFNCFR